LIYTWGAPSNLGALASCDQARARLKRTVLGELKQVWPLGGQGEAGKVAGNDVGDPWAGRISRRQRSAGTYVRDVRPSGLLMGISKAPVARKCSVL
jgi:hypothetical protein